MLFRRRTRLVALAICAALALIATIVIVAGAGSGTPSLTAVFANASPLVNGNLVKANGVTVGKVSSIKLKDGKADVAISLNDASFPLHTDARATIQPISLLGERFVSLDPGSQSAPLMGRPAVIGPSNTGSSVTLDEVLNTLNDPTSASLASLVTGLGTGVEGQGANIDRTLQSLVPAMTNTDQLVKILDQQNSVLNQTITTIAPGFQALDAGQGSQLNQLVQKATQALATVAAERQQMSSTLDQLPTTLANAQQTLAQLAGVAGAATPVLQSIKPVTDNLDQITRQLHTFADAANPALAHLPAVLTKVNALLDQARPVAAGLLPTSQDLAQAAQAALPLGQAVLDHAPGQPSTLDAALNGVADWAMATSDFDGLGHFFRAEVIFSTQVGESGQGLKTNAATAAPAAQPAAVTPAAQPAATNPLANIPADITNTLNNLLPNLGSQLNPTGLTPTQQQGLLSQLLGGL